MLRLLVAVIILSGMLPANATGGMPIVLEDGMILPPEPLGLHLEVLHDEWLTDNPKTVMIDGCKQWTAQEVYDVLTEAGVALATEEELLATKV